MVVKRCIPVMEMACLRVECHKPTKFELQKRMGREGSGVYQPMICCRNIQGVSMCCVLLLLVCPNYMQSDYFAIFMEY